MEVELPYRAEYAKSGRSSCRGCKSNIGAKELRLAVMVQSPMFDSKVPHWHHVRCFFSRQRPKAVGDIAHFESLRWDDQESIRQKLSDALLGKVGTSNRSSNKKNGGGSKERESKAVSKYGTLLSDFRTEPAKSGGSKCRICEQKIPKGAARIGKKDFDSPQAMMHGPVDRWHHVQCFASNVTELEYFDAGSALPGFKTLAVEDQSIIDDLIKPNTKGCKRKITSSKNEPMKAEPSAKSSKSSLDDRNENNEKLMKQLKKQNDKLFYYRDMLERNLKKKEMEQLCLFNDQQVPVGIDRTLDRLSDCMQFGALLPCSLCKNGQFVFRSGLGYQCLGDLSEWTKCQNVELKPARKDFYIPADMREKHAFLKLYKSKIQDRLLQQNASTAQRSHEAVASADASLVKKEGKEVPLMLRNYEFFLDQDLNSENRNDQMWSSLTSQIHALGGRVVKKPTKKTVAIVATKAAFEHGGDVFSYAMKHRLPVLEPKLFGFKESAESFVENIGLHTLSTYAHDSVDKFQQLLEPPKRKHASSTLETKFGSQSKSMVVNVKNGAYVDPESNLASSCHVLKERKNLFTAVLNSVDVAQGRNSYYKLQLLESDHKPHEYFVFRSWGRIGTTIGGTKVEDFETMEDAKKNFRDIYEDKTGNLWSKRDKFKKVAGKFFPLDMDTGDSLEDKAASEMSAENSDSKLAMPIKKLMTLIFDLDAIKRTMLEFEIDLTKMPLGKVSKEQIKTAYAILSEAIKVMEKKDNDMMIVDISNRFFTLIPHDFGMKTPPKLDDIDFIKSKVEMLDNLLEMECAFDLLKRPKLSSNDIDPIDVNYAKLKTHIHVLDKSSKEFAIIKKYVENTHASTHNQYRLAIQDVFKVEREGESSRFTQFSTLPNRKLLWHGSRTTNYAGILSQGLRIAPKEAPSTGYMFGKGIYFADIVSKSANYCHPECSDDTGLLLLCDVALGEMQECFKAEYIEALPEGKDSTKGIGKSQPDPQDFEYIDGALVPFGKPVKVDKETRKKSVLLYNEYIVYDVAQCYIKYLLRINFMPNL